MIADDDIGGPGAVTGPDAGLDRLYGVYREELRRFLLIRTGSAETADDILQELWIRARQSPGTPIGNGRAYMYRMAQNLVIDRKREEQARSRREHAWSSEGAKRLGPGAEPADASLNAEEALLEREELERLAAAIAQLPPGARRAFQLHKLEGLSHADVAATLGITKSGVEKHMSVALKYLRRAMLD